MKYVVFVVLLVLTHNVAAYTGICFLDAILNLFDGIWNSIKSAVYPTTSTTSSSTITTSVTLPTTSSTSTSSTTSYTSTTSSTLTPTSTSTTLAIKCFDKSDCPQDSVMFKCNFQGNVVRETRVFYCANPGEPSSECKSRQTQREHNICATGEKCVLGQENCVKN